MIEDFKKFEEMLDLGKKRKSILKSIEESGFFEGNMKKDDFIKLFSQLINLEIAYDLEEGNKEVVNLYFIIYRVLFKEYDLKERLWKILEIKKIVNKEIVRYYEFYRGLDLSILKEENIIDLIKENVKRVVLEKFILYNKESFKRIFKVDENENLDVVLLIATFVVPRILSGQRIFLLEDRDLAKNVFRMILYSIFLVSLEYIFKRRDYEYVLDNIGISYSEIVLRKSDFNKFRENILKNVKLSEVEREFIESLVDYFFDFFNVNSIDSNDPIIEDLFFGKLGYLYRNFSLIKDFLNKQIIKEFLSGKIDEDFFEQEIEKRNLVYKLRKYFGISQDLKEDIKNKLEKFVSLYGDKIPKDLRKKILEEGKIDFFIDNVDILRKLPIYLLYKLVSNDISFYEIRVFVQNFKEDKLQEVVEKYLSIKKRFLVDINWFIENYKNIDEISYFLEKLENLKNIIEKAQKFNYPDNKFLENLTKQISNIDFQTIDIKKLKNFIAKIETSVERSGILNFIQKRQGLLELVGLNEDSVEVLNFYLKMLGEKNIRLLANYDIVLLKEVKKFIEELGVQRLLKILKDKEKSGKVEQIHAFWKNLFDFFEDVRNLEITSLKGFVDTVCFYDFDQYFDKRWEIFSKFINLIESDKRKFKKLLTLYVGKDFTLKRQLITDIYSLGKKLKKLLGKSFFSEVLLDFYLRIEEFLEEKNESLIIFLEKLDEYLDLLFLLYITNSGRNKNYYNFEKVIDFDYINTLDIEDITKVKGLYLITQNIKIVEKFIFEKKFPKVENKLSTNLEKLVSNEEYITLSSIKKEVTRVLGSDNIFNFTFGDIVDLLKNLRKEGHNVVIGERKRGDHHICYVNGQLVVIPYRDNNQTYPPGTIVSIVKSIFKGVLQKEVKTV